MRIIAGISNAHRPEEIQAYAQAGVDEFFVGYVPAEWSDEYGWELSNNRRETAHYQYRSKNDLANVVNLIRKEGKKVFLTVNAHEYNTHQTKLLLRILGSISDIEFDGFIISNIGMLLELQKNGFNQVMNISIGGGSNNIETLQFFCDNFKNIGRFILPRKLTLSEIEKISTFARENKIRLEAFGMAAFCVFNDEYCFTWHGPSNKCFCQSPMFEFREMRPLLFDTDWKKEVSGEEIGVFYRRQAEIRSEVDALRTDYSVKHPKAKISVQELSKAHLLASLNKCGLCAFQKFKDWGIEAVKLPLRGQDFKGNIGIVQIARKAIEAPDATVKFCQDLMASPNFCSGTNCYYDYPYPK
jgi:collagenase-like PrtC family protease